MVSHVKGSFTLGGGNGNGKIIFRRECSHWGGVSGNGNGKMQCYQIGCRCHCRHKWVSNPFHEVAVNVTFAVAVAAPSVNTPIGLHTTYS